MKESKEKAHPRRSKKDWCKEKAVVWQSSPFRASVVGGTASQHGSLPAPSLVQQQQHVTLELYLVSGMFV